MENRFATEPSQMSKKLTFQNNELLGMLCGEHNHHLKILEKKTGVSVSQRGNQVILQGGDWEVELAEKVITQLYDILESDYPIYENDVNYAIRIISSNGSADLK
ncbi:MAG: phosphate starvation-inducible protein PhoH, partial [Deltaproteobacteria bacterium]|nr:phosphate starvation-inducible protein PhoH [Deltaproteobacteria bacterium]